MRILSAIGLMVVFTSCETVTDNDRLIRDLAHQYREIAAEKFARAEATYRSGHEFRLKDMYEHAGVENGNLRLMTNRLDRMFHIVTAFTGFADSVLNKYSGDSEYPLEQLLSRYGSAIDSLNAYHRISESKLKVTDFRKSSFIQSPDITIARMKADIAGNGHEAMYAYIDVTAPHSIFDDFSTPVVKPLYKEKSAYAFTIHYRAGQEYPHLYVAIDTLMLNRKLIKPKGLMHHDDILWVVSFDKPGRGKYEVHGSVRAITNRLDVRPFTHRFEIF